MKISSDLFVLKLCVKIHKTFILFELWLRRKELHTSTIVRSFQITTNTITHIQAISVITTMDLDILWNPSVFDWRIIYCWPTNSIVSSKLMYVVFDGVLSSRDPIKLLQKSSWSSIRRNISTLWGESILELSRNIGIKWQNVSCFKLHDHNLIIISLLFKWGR